MNIQEEIKRLTAQLRKIPAKGAINLARRRSIMQRIEELQLMLH